MQNLDLNYKAILPFPAFLEATTEFHRQKVLDMSLWGGHRLHYLDTKFAMLKYSANLTHYKAAMSMAPRQSKEEPAGLTVCNYRLS